MKASGVMKEGVHVNVEKDGSHSRFPERKKKLSLRRVIVNNEKVNYWFGN